MATLNTIRRPHSLRYPAQRVGRGQSSGRGKQSGRGGKGQTARAGAKIRPAWRDIIKKLPKRRGFGKNRGRTVIGNKPRVFPIPLSKIASTFESGSTISLTELRAREMLGRKSRLAKIVGSASLDKKFTLKGIAVSTSARAAIEKAGGVIQ